LRSVLENNRQRKKIELMAQVSSAAAAEGGGGEEQHAVVPHKFEKESHFSFHDPTATSGGGGGDSQSKKNLEQSFGVLAQDGYVYTCPFNHDEVMRFDTLPLRHNKEDNEEAPETVLRNLLSSRMMAGEGAGNGGLGNKDQGSVCSQQNRFRVGEVAMVDLWTSLPELFFSALQHPFLRVDFLAWFKEKVSTTVEAVLFFWS
jgi:hypothetical protein